MSEPPDESVLVSAAKRGDRSAFARLHELYDARMNPRNPLGPSSSIGGRGPRSGGVPHGAAQSCQGFGTVGALDLGWLESRAIERRTGIAARASLSSSETTSRHRPSRKRISMPSASWRRSARFPRPNRTPLLLRLAEGLTGPEIAAKTGLSPGSVRVNLHRGMKQLREALGWEKVHEIER
jgi:RNA polymerase sigma-70 factor (ECF subfamily)